MSKDVSVSGECMAVYVFFYKQKTAYEMRISDWSSDVCSSDLKIGTAGQGVAGVEADCLGIGEDPAGLMVDEGRYDERVEPFGINRRLPSERADRTVLGCGFRSQPQPDILRTIILILRGKDRQLVGAEGHALLH